MESTKDSVSLSYADNDELKAALAGKEPGQSCKLVLTVTTKANSDEGFEAIIDEVEVSDYEETEDEVEEADDSEDSDEAADEEIDPVMVVVAKKNKKDASS